MAKEYIRYEVDLEKVGKFLEYVVNHSQGPREAFSILCLTLLELERYNCQAQKITSRSTEDLIKDISLVINSVQDQTDATH